MEPPGTWNFLGNCDEADPKITTQLRIGKIELKWGRRGHKFQFSIKIFYGSAILKCDTYNKIYWVNFQRIISRQGKFPLSV